MERSGLDEETVYLPNEEASEGFRMELADD